MIEMAAMATTISMRVKPEENFEFWMVNFELEEGDDDNKDDEFCTELDSGLNFG